MIGIVQSPNLLKAAEFLFEGRRTILGERRKSAERAQSGEKDREPDPALPAPEAVLW